jgi:hypothetical protein
VYFFHQKNSAHNNNNEQNCDVSVSGKN